MKDLIEREAALAAIDRWAYTQTGWYEHPDLDAIEDAAKAIIRSLPTATDERRCGTCGHASVAHDGFCECAKLQQALVPWFSCVAWQPKVTP